MSGRSGPFWDSMEGRAPLPHAAATLGMELVDADVEAGTVELASLHDADRGGPVHEQAGGQGAVEPLDGAL
jgi:hypothetical protein